GRNRPHQVSDALQAEALKLIVGRRVPEFLHDLFDREAAGSLTRRELLCATSDCAGSSTKACSMNQSHVIARLLLAALERIGAQVEQPGRTQLHQRLHPDIEPSAYRGSPQSPGSLRQAPHADHVKPVLLS